MVGIFYALGFALALSCFLDLRVTDTERLFSFAIVRVLLSLPLLAGVYIYVSLNLQYQLIAPLFFVENVFTLIWFFMAYRLHQTSVPADSVSKTLGLSFVVAGTAAVGAGSYGLFNPPAAEILEGFILFPSYGYLYFSSVFMLVALFAVVWRLEIFWRALDQRKRWQFKYLVIGIFLVCGSLFWLISYRLLYRRLAGEHHLLAALLLLIAWFCTVYAVLRHRLLNRKLFLSRQVIYSAVAPITFAGYLILLGFVSLLMRAFGWSLPYVLQWLLIVIGLLLVVVLIFSGRVRSSVKYFISTHFYMNKYDYRNEWIALSRLLQGVLSEDGIIAALEQVLGRSLYTNTLCIWVGDENRGYRVALRKGFGQNSRNDTGFHVPPDDPLVRYLKIHDHYRCPKAASGDAPIATDDLKNNTLVSEPKLALFVPMISGDQLIGMIGVGPEYTGGVYSQDDFDLLLALGTQTAMALQAGRMAEALARVRQQEAWNIMSSFVLHDVKNAASMLSLIRQNAVGHLDNPEFQQDLLDTIDDALKRMGKVQSLLVSLKGKMKPVFEQIELCETLRNSKRAWHRRLPGLDIAVSCDPPIVKKTDTQLLLRVMENLLLNALEAGGPGTRIDIACHRTADGVAIEVRDNGPGLPPDLLPDALFEPFATSKPKGSGVGLWQAKRLVDALQGDIRAYNSKKGGAVFVIRLGPS